MSNEQLLKISQEFDKQIRIFNKKHEGKYFLTLFLDKHVDIFYIYLHYKEGYFYTFTIPIDYLDKFEPKYVIFRLIENGFIKEVNK